MGGGVIGERAAIDLSWVLWAAGVIGGLFTAVSIPFLMFTQHDVEPDAAFGGWLMPIVPPMVAAAAGALLIPHTAPGAGGQTLLYGCWAMFGLSLVAASSSSRYLEPAGALRHFGDRAGSHPVDRPRPGGAVNHCRRTSWHQCGIGRRRRIAGAMNTFAILYGVPVWGFAVLWIALATSLTVRTIRRGMPFALTWWSLTFPVGTFVTGTTQLAAHTVLAAFKVAAVIAYAGLLGTWLLVAVRTARGTLRGNLLAPPPNTGPVGPTRTRYPVFPNRTWGAYREWDGPKRRIRRVPESRSCR